MSNDELFNLISNKLKSKDWKKQPFNIFNACGIENQETAHSAFIANLLNPDGTHECGNLFLIKFMEILKSNFSDIAIENLSDNVWVETEHDEKKVGRFDIWIKSKSENAYMIIENKIYAGDVKNQIFRYHTFLNGISKKHNAKRNGILIYLTVNKKAASEFSTSLEMEINKSSGYYCISYHDTIKKWLRSCLDIKLDIRLMYWIQQFYELIDLMTFDYNLKDEIILLGIKKGQIENILQEPKKTLQEKRFLKYLIYSINRLEEKEKN